MFKLAKLAKDLLFPKFCAQCGKEGEWWCKDCLNKTEILRLQFCPVCSKKTLMGLVCPKRRCRAGSYLDGITVLFNYAENGPATRLIKQFKYGYAYEIEEVWKRVIREKAAKFFSSFNDFAVVPVPLHSRRERERGFNQAYVLARLITEKFGMKLCDFGLRRIRYTSQQAKLSGDERRKSLEGAFVWDGNSPAPERILLIDDVFTSGATMQECAKILKRAGARKVYGFALARG